MDSVDNGAASSTVVCAGFLVWRGAVFFADFVRGFTPDFVRLGVFRIFVFEIYADSGLRRLSALSGAEKTMGRR
jgi:hypothetical protein